MGEPINPEAWLWYHKVVGEGRCPIVDTWWQTETGAALIAPVPSAVPLKPGSATLPLPGVQCELVDAEGEVLEGAASGNLCLTDSWPGQMRSVYGDHQRFIDTYFKTYPGKYFTGDGCRRDEDGYYWITGRVDDVINVSGHRIGTAEVESALVGDRNVAEAAVVGFPHDIKGQGLYAYVTLKQGVEPTDALKAELVKQVRTEIGPFAAPDVIQWAPGLPKTRSGKIMRRILRKDRRERGRCAGRHLDAGGPRSGGRSGEEPGGGYEMSELGPTLTTPRLTLRPPRTEDFDAFAGLMADPRAMDFIGGAQVPARGVAHLHQYAGQWAMSGYGFFLVWETATETLVGRVGTHMPVGWPGQEVGWAIAGEAHGKGYATEAATAAMDWAFGTLGWEEVIHCIDAKNEPSMAVARRLGSRVLREAMLPPPIDHECVVWGQTAADWRARKAYPALAPLACAL